jgi:hypothetical protein
MIKKFCSQTAPARRSLDEGGFFNLRLSMGLFFLLAGVFFAVFAMANPSQLGSGAVAHHPKTF